LNRTRSPSGQGKVWVGAKLSNDQPQVLSIVAESPAALAGLAVGDVVDSVSYRRVTTTPDVVKMLQQKWPGDVVDFIVVRKNIRYLYRVKLTQPPSK
jgi:S1-C subfamily serine protease